MEAELSWMYSSLEELIDMDTDCPENKEEATNDRANFTAFSDGSPKPSTEHTE